VFLLLAGEVVADGLQADVGQARAQIIVAVAGGGFHGDGELDDRAHLAAGDQLGLADARVQGDPGLDVVQEGSSIQTLGAQQGAEAIHQELRMAALHLGEFEEDHLRFALGGDLRRLGVERLGLDLVLDRMLDDIDDLLHDQPFRTMS
jgi:hypothetical protein